MDRLIVPDLFCPFPSALNQYVETAYQHTLDWSLHYQLIQGERAIARFKAAKFAWLAARAYPRADLEQLQVVAEWNIWLFMHDDQCDEAGIGKHPRHLARLYDQLRAVLHGATPAAIDTSYAHALYELWQRLHSMSTPHWRRRFLQSVDDYFRACIWEAENRAAGRIPDAPTYIEQRPYTGALNTDVELIEVCEHIHLPDAVHAHPHIVQMTLNCNNAVCWSNDIISLEKELQSGDMHNLVIAVRHEQNLSWQAAVDHVARMHDREVQSFIRLEQSLPAFGAEIDKEVDRYVNILRAWMRGNLDWAYDTGRYGMPQRERVV